MNWNHVLTMVGFRGQSVFLVLKSLFLSSGFQLEIGIHQNFAHIMSTSWVMSLLFVIASFWDVFSQKIVCLCHFRLTFLEKNGFKIKFTGKWINMNKESITKNHIYSLQYHPHHIPQFAPLPFFYFIMVRIDQSRWSNQTKQVLPSTNLLQATNYIQVLQRIALSFDKSFKT